MKTFTIAAVAAGLLAGAAMLAAAPAIADGGGWGGRHHMGMGGGFGPGAGMGFGPGAGMGPMRMFEEADADNDGRLTQQEIDTLVGSKYAEANTDGQPGVTIGEFETWFWQQNRQMMVRAFQHFDTDGDGSITEEEARAMTEGIVQRMDRDGDGALSPADRQGRGWGRRGGDDDDRWGWGRRGGDDDDDDWGRRGGGWGPMMDGQGMGPGMGPGQGQGMGPGMGPGQGQQPPAPNAQ